MATLPITKRGAEKLKAELHNLKTVQRPWVINAISEARAQGDLSENAEYEVAKDRQGFIEGRIQEIEGKLSAAQVIDPASLEPGTRVVFGSTVKLEDEDTGDSVTYQIVGEDEADIKAGKISVSSPIARALIGKYAGDTVDVQAPAGAPEWASHLHDLGFMPGERVQLMARGIGGDPLVVRVGHSTYALRRAEAACVHIHPGHASDA